MMRRRGGERRGFMLAAALVALTVLTLLSAEVLRSVALTRQQAQLAYNEAQADWLAEAGLERARVRLTADPAYAGETWEIPAGALAGRSGAQVRIQVDETGADTASRRVEVSALYPRDGTRQARRGRALTLPAEASVTGESR